MTDAGWHQRTVCKSGELMSTSFTWQMQDGIKIVRWPRWWGHLQSTVTTEIFSLVQKWFIQMPPFSNRGGWHRTHLSLFFCELHNYRRRCSTRTHSSLAINTTYVNPTLMSTLKDCAGTSRDWQSHRRHLAVDGNVIYHWKNNTVKSWNKSRKIRTPVPNRGLEPWWAGSTTRNLTNWARLNSHLGRTRL
jgi:hypothetical protein